MINFGKTIKAIRKQLSMSIEELALNLDITPSQLRAWESGSRYPSIETVNRIISTLGLTYRDFFDGYDD